MINTRQASTKSKKVSYTLLAILGLMLAFVIVRFLMPSWTTHRLLTWDVMGYYLYLPAIFTYSDFFTLSFLPDILATYNPTPFLYQAIALDGGDYVMRYTYGVSLFYLPFFLLGHLAAYILNYPTDGFSAPYQFFIGISAIVYTGIALWLLRKVLVQYFSDSAIALALLVLLGGTNFLQYVAIDGAMPHSYLFLLYALVLYYTMRWHQSPRWHHALIIGLAIGLATLSRPTEIIIGLLPLLWGISSKASLQDKIHLLAKHYRHLFILALAAAIVILPQLLYWKATTGQFLYYTYDDQGFEWGNPHIGEILVSFRKGWLLYTPLAGLALLGFFFLHRRAQAITLALLTFFLLNFYIIASWSIWWYSGSYSCRALVQSYAILLFPLAALFQFLLQRRWSRIAILLFILPFLALNTLQLWQYNQGIIHAEEMRKHYFYAIFGKTKITQSELALLDVKATLYDEHHYQKTLLAKQDFEQDSTQTHRIQRPNSTNPTWVYTLNPDNPLSPMLDVDLNTFPHQTNHWLKISTQVRPAWGAPDSWLVAALMKDEQPIRYHSVRLYNILTQPNACYCLLLTDNCSLVTVYFCRVIDGGVKMKRR